MSHLDSFNCLHAWSPSSHATHFPALPPPISLLHPTCTVSGIIFLSSRHKSLLHTSLDTWALFILFDKGSCEDDSHLPSQLLGWQLASTVGIEDSELQLLQLWCLWGGLVHWPAEQVALMPWGLVTASWCHLGQVSPPIHALSNASPESLHALFSCKPNNC